MQKPVRLRGHHLLCMLTWVGKGYSAAFSENFTRCCKRLEAGSPALVVEGPDDVCAPLLDESVPHCLQARCGARDRQALADVSALLGRPLAAGLSIAIDEATLARLRQAFAAGAIRTACAQCEWSALCTEVAAGGFAATLLRGA